MPIEVKNLSFSYGDRPVLQDISFSVEKGEFLSILGPNGVGKSTLFRCILGRLDGYGGSIASDGDDLKNMPRREAARRMAYIPQIHTPTFSYSVIDTVLMGTARQLSPFAQPGRQQVARAMEALERVGVRMVEEIFTVLDGGQAEHTYSLHGTRTN